MKTVGKGAEIAYKTEQALNEIVEGVTKETDLVRQKILRAPSFASSERFGISSSE